MDTTKPGLRAEGDFEKTPVSQRVLGAVLYVGVFIGTLFWGPLPFAVGMAVVSIIGAAELYNMFEKKEKGVPPAAFLGMLASAAYVILAHFRPLESFGYITAALLLSSFLWYMVVLKSPRPTVSISLTVLAPAISGFCLSHLVLLRNLVDGTSRGGKGGLWFVLYIMALIWVYDVVAWAVGRKFGVHKMTPVLSPKKSWEGLIAGTLAAIGASFLFRVIVQEILGENGLTWFSPWVALVVGIMICAAGPIGDLSESLMKREHGVKDSGSLIPGHGGVMDRFDSTMFSAPAVFYYLLLAVIKT